MASDSYTAEQQRVADYILEAGKGNLGAGDDPIGFLIAAHAFLAEELRSRGPNSEFSIKRAAYVLSVAVLQSDLTLDEEVRAAMDLAVSLGQDRAVMYNRPPHATLQPFLCLGEGLTMRCPNQCADCQKEQAKNER